MDEDVRQVGPYAALHKGFWTNKPNILEIYNWIATGREPFAEQNAAMTTDHDRNE
jgi:hypothetical protein